MLALVVGDKSPVTTTLVNCENEVENAAPYTPNFGISKKFNAILVIAPNNPLAIKEL